MHEDVGPISRMRRSLQPPRSRATTTPSITTSTGGEGWHRSYGGMLAIDPKSIPVTTVAGTAVGVGVFQDMLVSYTAGMFLTIPWFMWRRQPANVAYAIAANARVHGGLAPGDSFVPLGATKWGARLAAISEGLCSHLRAP